MRQGLWWIFGVYCVLVATEWLLPPLPVQLRGLVVAVVGITAVGARGRKPWNRPSEVGQLALAAVLLIGVPELLSRWAVQHVTGAMSTAVLGLVPVILVLVVAQEKAGARRLLAPSVAGLGGILLLIPLSLAESFVGWIAVGVLIGAAVLVSLAGVRIHLVLQNFDWVQAVSVVCLANAAAFLGVGIFLGGAEWRADGAWSSVAASGAEVVLLVLLLREITPVRLGARFFLVPLLTIVEGVVLLRPELTSRMVAGAALLAGGALFLLLSRETEEETSLSLR
jgi:drug/metabolite transporter (DMT)-like permease